VVGSLGRKRNISSTSRLARGDRGSGDAAERRGSALLTAGTVLAERVEADPQPFSSGAAAHLYGPDHRLGGGGPARVAVRSPGPQPSLRTLVGTGARLYVEVPVPAATSAALGRPGSRTPKPSVPATSSVATSPPDPGPTAVTLATSPTSPTSPSTTPQRARSTAVSSWTSSRGGSRMGHRLAERSPIVNDALIMAACYGRSR
jgi:hypothetical protein